MSDLHKLLEPFIGQPMSEELKDQVIRKLVDTAVDVRGLTYIVRSGMVRCIKMKIR
jgi:hypothetical protein